MKSCLYCNSEIQDDAVKCRFCGEMLVRDQKPPLDPQAIGLPNVWPGLILAVIVFVGFMLGQLLPAALANSLALNWIRLICTILAVIYWFICLYGLHKTAEVLSDHCYPISPAMAVLLGFVPLFNLYWLFKWPAEMIAFVRQRTPQLKTWPAVVLSLSLLIGVFVQGVAMLALFVPLAYLADLLRKSHQVEPVPAPYRKSAKSAATVVIIALCLGAIPIMGLLAAIAIPNFIMARNTAQARNCVSNLIAIEAAKQAWFRDHPEAKNTSPTWADLIPKYLDGNQVCPKGGIYTAGPIGVRPTCSIGDNRTPQRTGDDHIL